MDEYSKNMDKMIEKTHDDELKNLLIKLKSLMERHHEIEQQYEKRGWNGKKLKKFEEIIKKDIARIREDKDKPSLIGGLVKKFEEEMGVLINKNKKHVESDIKTTHERLEEGEIEIKNPLQKVAAVKGLHSENEEVRNNALESYIKHIDSIANEDERNKARERLIKRLVVKSKFGETEAERSNAQKILKELRERDEYRGVFDKDDELIENIREVRERKGILSGAEFQKKIEGLDDEKYQRIVNELKEGKYTADRRDIYYLINAFKYKDKNVRTYALEALENIGEPAVLPLIYALKYENENMRKHAAEALKHMASNNSEVFDSKTKEKIKKRISEETDKEVKKILFETLKICGESKKELIEEVFEHQLTAKLSEDINYLKEATQIISHLQIQRQIPKYFLKGDLIALRFKVIDELSKGETKENIITKLKNYLRGVFHYNKYLPTVGIEIEIWEIYTHKLDSVFASRVIDLFGITEGKDELIEYAPDPSEKFTNQLIIAEKLKQYNLIPSKENYPLDISLGVFDESTDRLEIENGLYLAYPLVMLYTSNTRLKRGIISGTQSIISIKRPRLEFRLLDFTYGLENTGTISPNSDYNYVHLLRDAQWLGAMLRAKYIGGNEMIEENLRRYFDEVYVGEVKNIFKKFGFINRAAIGKKLIELRNTTNIQQQCKALVDKTRNNIRAIINGESINLFLELQKNEDLSYKTPEEMKDIDATTQLGLSKLMHTAIIRPDEKPTQERIEAQKLSEDKLKEIYKNNPKLYGMTVKTLKYNGAEKQKPHIDKTDTHVKLSQKTLKPEGFLGHFLSGLRHKDKTVRDDARKSVFEGDDEEQKEKAAKSIISNMRYAKDSDRKENAKAQYEKIKNKDYVKEILEEFEGRDFDKKIESFDDEKYQRIIDELKEGKYKYSEDEKDIYYLIKALRNEDKYVRYHAAKALGNIAENLKKPIPDNHPILDAIDPLITALGDLNPIGHAYAVGALVKIGEPAIPALIKALRDPNPIVREYATRALENISEHLKKPIPNNHPILNAIDPLITALGDEDKYVRRRTASLLKYIAKNIEKPIPNNHPILNAIDPLITTLGDERMDVRKDSAIALKYIASKNQKFFDSKIKEKIVYKMRQEKNKEIKLILAQTLNILGEKKLDIVKETIDYDKSYNQKMNKILSRDIALLDEATKIINQMKIKRQMPEYYTYNGDLIALKFRVIDLLARGETKEKIYSKLKNYLKSTFRYNQYLPTIGTEVEIWDMFHAEWNESINELDPDFARIITLLFDINDSRDKLIEYCPDPNENFTSQMIILEKLRQYDLIVGKSEYPFHLSLGIKGDEEDKNIEKDGACIAYPLMILYTTNNRLDKGSTISNPNFVWKKEENRLEFRLFYFVNNVDNTGIIDSNPKFSYVHLLRDLQWLGSMLKAKYNGFNEKINKNLVDYFKNQYIPELEKIFNDVEINNDNKQRKILLELRNTTNIQQQCKSLVDKTRNNIRAIINGENIDLFLELQKNEDLSYKTTEEMKDIDTTTQSGLSKLMHTAIIRPDEKPTQERIEAQKLSEDKLKEIYKNNPKLYGMTVKTIKYNSAEKQKSYLEKIDANARIKPQENRILNRGLEGVEKILKHEGASTPQIDRIEEKGDVKKTDSSVFGRLKKLIKPKKEEVHFGGDKNEKNIEKLKNIKPKRFFRNLLKRKSKQKKLNSTIYEKMIEDLKKDDWEKYAKEKYFWYLIKALKDKYVYLNAVKSLVKIGDSIIKPLFDLLKKEVNEYVVLVIVKIYQETQSDKILKELNRFSINELHEIRALCIHSLMSKEILKIIIEKQKNEEIEEKIPFGREHGHPEEPKSVIIETKEQYEIYKNLIKKAYSLGIAKIDVDFMVYSINNLYWNSISRAKTSREITGVWRGADFAELETSMTIDEFKTVYSGYNNQIFFSVHLLFSVCYYAQPVLFFVKNIPLKHTSNHVIANQNFSFSKVEKIYILSDYKNISRNNINLLKETKQKYPHIEILFSSSKYINEHSDETENFDFLLQKKKQLLEEINKLNNSISKEQANSYRLYLEGIDIDIDFLIKLKKNMKSFKKFYEDNEGVFDKLKLVENKLHGTDTTFKEFRKQWDDWFPHLEQYDYFKNITYRGGYASKLSRQINEEINKVDSGKYDNDDFKEIEEKSGVEFKDAKKELGGWTDKGTYIDKDGRKWLFKQADAKEKYKAYAEVCAYEFAKLIDSNAVEVRYFEHDGKIGNLQEMIPGAETLEHVNIENLTNDQLKQLQKHSIIDWMVANQEAYARHFLTKNRIIYEIDKGDTLYVFGDKEYHYTPFNHSRYHYELNDACINGKIDLKWEDIEPFIKKAESITNAKYINIFRPYLEERFKNDLNDKKEFIKLMLERKRNLRNDFEKLYKSLAEQRQINGFSISEKKPNNNIRQETQQLQLITDQLDGAMNQLIKKADGTITSAEKSAKEEQPANINDEPSEPPIDSQNPPTEEQIKKQEEGILRDINKAIENLDKLDRGGKS